MQNRWVRVAVLVAGWAALGLLLTLELYFNSRAGMKLGTVDFVDIAIPQFGRAIMWAALAPLVLQLRVKAPLARGRWVGPLLFHLAMSFVVMAVFYAGRMFGYSQHFVGFDDFWGRLIRDFYGRNIIDMAYYWAVLGFGYSWEIYERYKSEELKAAQLESRLAELELKTLREQLQPHFLFNALNTIAVLVREQRNEEAVTLIARLSALLRATLDAARTPEVTLRQELDFLQRYVDIQKARFSDRLTVEIDAPEETLGARIPNLLLQPLVENAILHGVAPKSGPGRVVIRAATEAGRLRLEVSDDGPGLPAADSGRQGIGLANTRERVAKIYGSAGEFALRSEPGRGVTVRIVLPFRA